MDTAALDRKLFSRIAGILVATLGVAVSLGWIFEITALKTVLPGVVSMKANTAAGMILAGMSLHVTASFRNDHLLFRIAALLAILLLGLGLTTLAQEVAGDLGVDQMLYMDDSNAAFTVHPGRMSVLTAICFSVAGAALLLLQRGMFLVVAQWLALLIMVMLLVPLGGYLFGAPALFQFAGEFTAIALHTVLGFFVLFAGVLAMTMEHGIFARLRNQVQAVAFGGAILLFLLCGLATYVNTERVVESHLWVSDAQEFNEQLEAIGSDMNMIVAAQRGFLLTGNTRFESVVRHHSDELMRHLGAARRLGSNNLTLQKLLGQLEPLIDLRLVLIGDLIKLRRAQGLDAVGNAVNSLSGYEIDQQIHKLIKEMNLKAQMLLEERQATARKINKSAYVALSFAGIAGLWLLILVYTGFRQQLVERKRAEEEIKSLAFYDPLTHLPNRRLLMDRLKQALASSARSGREGALLFIDLDNFKTLNDTLGHDIGDLLLQQVALRLESCVREGDTVARLGGDEFVVMLEDLSELILGAAAQTEVVGEKILYALNQPYRLGMHEHSSTPSIGVTIFSDHEQNLDELLKQADIAMYQAKQSGRNALRFFDPKMQDTINARVAMEADLRRAVAEQEQFMLYYQAQVDSTGRLIGAEALVRWQHPERGLVSPAEFIPLAEETGLILPLGHWVLATACRQLASWKAQPQTSDLTLAVNISAKQFHLPTFVDEVLTLVDHFGVNPARLKLEITESMLLNNVDDIISKMSALKARGISFSMDDFGTGYSSLQYLKRLPLSQLKIDQSFVRDIAADDSDKAIVRTIIAMAQSMNLNVIAEGVETEAQRLHLMNKDCTAFQGYLFGKPMTIEQFEIVLKQI